MCFSAQNSWISPRGPSLVAVARFSNAIPLSYFFHSAFGYAIIIHDFIYAFSIGESQVQWLNFNGYTKNRKSPHQFSLTFAIFGGESSKQKFANNLCLLSGAAHSPPAIIWKINCLQFVFYCMQLEGSWPGLGQQKIPSSSNKIEATVNLVISADIQKRQETEQPEKYCQKIKYGFKRIVQKSKLLILY